VKSGPDVVQRAPQRAAQDQERHPGAEKRKKYPRRVQNSRLPRRSRSRSSTRAGIPADQPSNTAHRPDQERRGCATKGQAAGSTNPAGTAPTARRPRSTRSNSRGPGRSTMKDNGVTKAVRPWTTGGPYGGGRARTPGLRPRSRAISIAAPTAGTRRPPPTTAHSSRRSRLGRGRRLHSAGHHRQPTLLHREGHLRGRSEHQASRSRRRLADHRLRQGHFPPGVPAKRSVT